MTKQKVITRVESRNYYRAGAKNGVGGKYYYGPEIIPAGSVGIIGVENVACVRLRPTCRCQTFVCVDFADGARASYHKHEITKVAPEVI